MLGLVDRLPEIYTHVEISFFLLRKLLGVKTDGENKDKKKSKSKVKKLQPGEVLMVNIGSLSTGFC